MKGKPGVKELVQQCVDNQIDVEKILKEGLVSAMEIVGQKFSDGEYFVPEMLLSAQAMKGGLQILEPLLKGQNIKKVGTVILGTVAGDMHDIGKNLVGMILEGAGFEVIDLGINTPADKFVQKAQEHPDSIIGLSALLTTTMGQMKVVVDQLRSHNLQNKVIIGGAAVSQKFAEEIGADGYSRDAGKAVPLVKGMLND
jgi:5-methyltetrahydrofolate--homocysteine methyltransferase